MNLSCVTLAALIGAASAFAPASSNSRLSTQVFAEKDDDMSKALPFAARPKILDGALPGDVGFE
jgi:hypothetical protein